MIEVKVKKSVNRLLSIEITGHANFDQKGKDIVCSAVSALAIGAVNSTEILLNVDVKPKESHKDGGYLAWNIPIEKDNELDEKVQLLMKALVESLSMVEKEYKQYINVIIEASQ